MTIIPQSEDGLLVRQLIPLSTLSVDKFECLCRELTIEQASRNNFLFKRNDITTELIYLIKGSVSLQSDNLKVETIKAGSESARFAIAHHLPRKIDAYTTTDIRFLRLNINTINALPDCASYEEENTNMIVDDPENDDDWMTTLLKSPIFKALPPAKLQQLLISLKEVSFEKGEVIIKQGDEGDYYYLIKKGQCLISRKPSATAKEIVLGKMRAQDTFGEDSLLSGAPRNVNIIALTKVILLRLNKEKFISLIKTPSLQFIHYEDISAELSSGALLIDVRSPDQYKKSHLPNSVNAPFFALRMQLKNFDITKKIVVICENGSTSEASAFLLLRHQFKAVIVEGGMEKLSAEGLSHLQKGERVVEEPSTKVEVSADISITESVSDSQKIMRLQQENQTLKQTIQSLKVEKETLEKNYRALYKQTEKLKIMLDKIRSH